MVTHDRWFLDEVAEQTWEVGDGTVRRYDGGYSAYVLARAERARQAAASEARRQNLLRKELAWLRRGPPARTSKPRFRIEAAQALIADEPPPRDSTRLQAFATGRLGKSVYDVEDVTLRGRRPHPARPRDLAARPGRPGRRGRRQRLRQDHAAAAAARPASTRTAGPVRVGQTVRAGVPVPGRRRASAELPGQLRLLEAVEQVARIANLGGVELTASQLAERFGFGASRQWTPVADLSGGERRRLQLLRLLMAEPNVLLLDEPTNDLDTDTLTALEDLLDTWPGTLVVVSHDRYLVERVCDSVVALLGDGSLAALPGGVDDYLARRRAARRGHRRAGGGPPGPGRHPGRGPRRPPGADPAGAADRHPGAAGGAAARGAGRGTPPTTSGCSSWTPSCGRSGRTEGRGRVGLAGAGGDRGSSLKYGPCCPYGWRRARDVDARSEDPAGEPSPAPGLPGRRRGRRPAAGRVRRRRLLRLRRRARRAGEHRVLRDLPGRRRGDDPRGGAAAATSRPRSTRTSGRCSSCSASSAC